MLPSPAPNRRPAQEAAEMYERAGQYERAASIYIQTKNFNAAAPLMAKVRGVGV